MFFLIKFYFINKFQIITFNTLKLWSIFILLKSFSIKFGIKCTISNNKHVLTHPKPPVFSKISTWKFLVGKARIHFDCSLCIQLLSLLAEFSLDYNLFRFAFLEIYFLLQPSVKLHLVQYINRLNLKDFSF